MRLQNEFLPGLQTGKIQTGLLEISMLCVTHSNLRSPVGHPTQTVLIFYGDGSSVTLGGPNSCPRRSLLGYAGCPLLLAFSFLWFCRFPLKSSVSLWDTSGYILNIRHFVLSRAFKIKLCDDKGIDTDFKSTYFITLLLFVFQSTQHRGRLVL